MFALQMQLAAAIAVIFVLTSSNAEAEQLLANDWSAEMPQPPPMPKFYTASGSIELPYAEISEPFTAFIDNERKLSRLDYYGGMVRTYQFANESKTGFLVHPVSTETEHNKRDCVRFGSVTAPLSVVPDLAGFQFLRTESIRGTVCNAFQNTTTFGDRVNTYTIWFGKSDSRPYRYDMIGYDSLLGSHYDRYYIEYLTFDTMTRPTSEDFEVKSQSQCHVAPSADAAAQLHPELNPMQELIHKDESHTQMHFHNFKKLHLENGRYVSSREERTRGHVFRQNLRYINSLNRAAKSYRLAVNHLADKSHRELKQRFHCRKPVSELKAFPTRLTFNAEVKAALPESLDWRIAGAVSPVKDQGICGSCWSFGAAGVMEGAYFVKTGKRARFSQQQLVDCSWGFGNNGCGGGDDVPSYGYIQKHGLALEEDYGKYLMQDAYCHSQSVNATVRVKGYMKVPQNNVTAMKVALFKNGPVSVAIDASHLSFMFYSTGVYYEKACSSTELDHAVLAVGYGQYNGESYWLIKNSWSFYWGNNGYVLMSMKDNNCGVMTSASQPVLA